MCNVQVHTKHKILTHVQISVYHFLSNLRHVHVFLCDFWPCAWDSDILRYDLNCEKYRFFIANQFVICVKRGGGVLSHKFSSPLRNRGQIPDVLKVLKLVVFITFKHGID